MDFIKDKDSKFLFIGIALAGLSTMESAAALIDRNMHIIFLDKLFAVSDVKYYLDNCAGKKNAVILASIPENEVMLSSKWKYNSRTYDLVNFDVKMMNRDDWTNRYSARCSDYLYSLKEAGIDVFRFDTANMKNVFGSLYAFKDRSPASCRALQSALRIKYGMYELPANMMPASQLEALLGAVLARMLVFGSDEFECINLGSFEGIETAGLKLRR